MGIFRRIMQKVIRCIYAPPSKKCFAKIGKNVNFPIFTDINNPKNVFLGDNVTFLRTLRLVSLGNNKIVFGSYIGPCLDLAIIAGADVIIEDNVSIAGNVFISAGNHGMDPTSGVCYGDQPYVGKKVIIRHNAWLGQNVSIMSGVEVGAYSIIGTGSVVTKSVPDYSIAVGNPAKVIKRFNHQSKMWEKI